MTGAKHLQEDMEKRLSSIGAIAPQDSSGRKKLRNSDDPARADEHAGVATMSKGSSRSKPDARGLQKELKTQEFELERTLSLLAEGGKIIVDYRSNRWGGCALIVKPTYQVIDTGVRGTGQAAWAKVVTRKGIVGLLSVYAPHSDRERMELWQWIQNLVGEEQWIISGDLNMVESGEDTNCVSPILGGEEFFKWMELCQESNLSDCYILAGTRVGSRFTRFQVKGVGVEMSRLDMIYITANGEWVDYISRITHDSRTGISDHSPVIADLKLVETENVPAFRKSYVKLSVTDLQDEGTQAKAIAAWQNDPPTVTDPRVRWDLAWRRIKSVVKEARREKKQKEVSREDLEKILVDWRNRLELENSMDNREGFRVATEMLREKDEVEAKLWKQRSRAKWMTESDAPTKYFFSLWRANMKQEDIRALKLEDGSITECRGRIMREIGGFYKRLFQDEGESQADIAEHGEVLQLINKKVSPEENERLERIPTDEDLDECVASLAKDKPLGLDGISADVLRDLWGTAKTLCRSMIDTVWEKEELTPSAKKGVIKLLPKNEVRCELTNWRPITLLGITYKVVSRIIADRIKPLMLGLVSGQQTGFIPGRTIFDSILSLKLGEEWAAESGQEAIFLKLDFIKAYDRVRHSFLWDTLAEMGFGPKIICLIQGLMKEAETLVHQNDDTGLCLKATQNIFEEAKRIVERFERISGAQLNVAKSLIIPIGLETVPRWLFETGCRVATEGEVWTYLGTPTGLRVNEEQIESFILEKLAKKAATLKMRLVARILDGEKESWIEMAELLITAGFAKKKVNRGKERTAAEILLMETPSTMPESRTLKHILTGWKQGRGKLQPQLENAVIHNQTEVEKLITAVGGFAKQRDQVWTPTIRRLRTMRVKTIDDLKTGPLSRLITADKLGYLPDRWEVEGPSSEPITHIKGWVGRSSEDGSSITDKKLWKWPNEERDEDQFSWQRTNAEWREVIQKQYRLREKSNASWGVSWDTNKWEMLWKSLWQAPLFTRDKLWVWRVLNKGFFTMERAATMGMAEPICGRCKAATENVDHLFYMCSETKRQWEQLECLHNRATGSSIQSTSLLGLLEVSLRPENAAFAAATVLLLRQIWRRRCKQVYEGRTQSIPLEAVLQAADRMTVNLKRKFTSASKLKVLQNCHKTLTLMRWFLSRDRYGAVDSMNSPGQSSRNDGMTHSPNPEEDERRTDREDASDGRHPKERDVYPGATPIPLPTYNHSESDHPSTSPSRVFSVMQELHLLGFEEFVAPETNEETFTTVP
ncbi:hypothetical protein R1sor_011718 [Riccia sorocarpa]|uniref:Reverse transcriptase domain-containing protein n=1 Tax=Riccia sorocarpa TaxID=122646 RepID=A0ABD3I4D9_9MARC